MKNLPKDELTSAICQQICSQPENLSQIIVEQHVLKANRNVRDIVRYSIGNVDKTALMCVCLFKIYILATNL